MPAPNATSDSGIMKRCQATSNAGTENSRRVAGRAAAAVEPARPISPLVTVLEKGVATGKVVKDNHGEVYTGFGLYSDLATSRCGFTPMNSNRAINRDVVKKRVEENEEAFQRTGRYLEFGQINLIINAHEPLHEFLVMDGQHRCETMAELHRRHPTQPLWFQFRAKVVASEPFAYQELRHFQKSYPTDERSFFRCRAEARVATAVLLKLKAAHGAAFRDMVLSDQRGRRTGDPPRPFLNDNLVFWLLQDSGLLGTAGDENGSSDASAAATLEALRRMDTILATLPRADLGRGVTQKMHDTAGRIGCWLGLFRDSDAGLRWSQVSGRLAEQQTSVRGVGAAPAEQQPECSICMEAPPVMVLIPCGHRCVCETCASAVRAAPSPRCPLCRAVVSGDQRVYLN